MAKLKRHSVRLGAVLVITLLSFGLMFGLGGKVQAAEDVVQLPRPQASVFAPEPQADPIRIRSTQGSNQVFRGDLVVEPGRVIVGDVAVYNGDVRMEDGGRIQGSLVAYSGDIELQEGAQVQGDVTAFSGDIDIAGAVGGDVASWSGDVKLADSARVDGDISVLSGEISRGRDAYVGGNVVEGPQLRLPGMPSPNIPMPPTSVAAGRPVGFLGWVGLLITRLLGAVILTALVVLLTGVVAYARPDTVDRVRRAMDDNLALSFVIGLLSNLTLTFLAGLLSVTICLLPIALIPIVLLIGVNLVGWTVVSQAAGERITAFIKQPVQPALTAAVGALALTGVVALLWAMGGCFRFIGYLTMLGVGSFGAGAVLLPWLNRGRNGGEPPARSKPTSAHPIVPMGGSSAPTPSSSSVAKSNDVPAGPTDETVLKDEPAEPLDYVAAQDVIAIQAEEVRDDSFVMIKGIGPVFEQRLKNAGIRTFGELAISSPERIAEIIGWPVERVLRTDLTGQARFFAEKR